MDLMQLLVILVILYVSLSSTISLLISLKASIHELGSDNLMLAISLPAYSIYVFFVWPVYAYKLCKGQLRV